jgi:hypothetical protein
MGEVTVRLRSPQGVRLCSPQGRFDCAFRKGSYGTRTSTRLSAGSVPATLFLGSTALTPGLGPWCGVADAPGSRPELYDVARLGRAR